MAYQNIPRFEPNYGNRYGFRQRVNAPATAGIDEPIPGTPGVPPTPQQVQQDTSARPSDYHSGPSAESDDGGSNAADVRTEAGLAQGHVIGQQTPGQIASNLLGIVSPIPGLGMIANKLGLPDSVDERLGVDIPAHERYGAAGTIDAASGGIFDTSGQAYDPITGEGLASYNSQSSFGSSPYVQGIFDNPFSIDSYLSDPVNAPRNQAALAARERGSRAALGFDAALLGDRGLYADDELGNVPTDDERARLAQHIGQTEYGFEEHTVAPDTATNEAIQGIGYTGSGAAPSGCQFSSTGTFSTQHSDNNNDSDNNDSFNDQGVSHSGGSGGVSFADDAASSNDGGGGGK